MPGVLLIEAMAQTSGWLLIGVTKFTRMPFFASVKEAKLRTFVTQGQQLSLSAHLLHEGSGFGVTKADIRCNGSLCAMPSSRSGWWNSRTPSFAPAWRRWPRFSSFRPRCLPMGDPSREVWITGIGIASCLGEGREAHWEALSNSEVKVNSKSFAPYLVHGLAPLDFDRRIPKKSDQRQMEAWQRIGTYAAGLALDDAGLKGNADLLARADMIVAAGGGERDIAVERHCPEQKGKVAQSGRFSQ